MSETKEPKFDPAQPFDTNYIRRWDDSENRKRISQLHGRLSEFLVELKTAQASVLLRTKEEYRERQAGFFVSQLSAVELCLTLLTVAKASALLSPKGWTEEPK